jgi:hypothetical protein
LTRYQLTYYYIEVFYIPEQLPNMDMTELARKVNEQNNTIIELQKNIDKLIQEKERCKTIADIQVKFA